MNDEDVCIAVRKPRDVNKMDVVLSQSHHGLVSLCIEAGLSDISPCYGAGVRGFFGTHIQKEQLAL